jgi:hypothetical protein
LSSILLPLESAAGASLSESGLKTFLHHRLPSKPFTYGLERDVCMYTTVPDGPVICRDTYRSDFSHRSESLRYIEVSSLIEVS